MDSQTALGSAIGSFLSVDRRKTGLSVVAKQFRVGMRLVPKRKVEEGGVKQELS